MSAILAVPVLIEVMAMAGLGAGCRRTGAMTGGRPGKRNGLRGGLPSPALPGSGSWGSPFSL